MLNSKIYCGSTTHARQKPARNRFTRPIYMSCIDLSELTSGALDSWPFFSSRHPAALTSLLARDHMIHEDTSLPLDERVRAFAARHRGGIRPLGSIFLVTNLRVLGVEFNPVSFYYIFSAESPTEVEAIVAEVSNFPWFEQYCYYTAPLLPNNRNTAKNVGRTAAASAGLVEYEKVTKRFHVSPFMYVDDMEYAWQFSTPRVHDVGSQMKVRINLRNVKQDKTVFYASMDCNLIQWSVPNLLKLQLTYPVHSLMVMYGILYQAAILFKKGFTFFPHPTGVTSRLSRAVEFLVYIFVPISQFFSAVTSIFSSSSSVGKQSQQRTVRQEENAEHSQKL